MRFSATMIAVGLLVGCASLCLNTLAFAQAVPVSDDIGAQSQRLQKKSEEIQKTFITPKPPAEQLQEEENLNKRQIIFLLKRLNVNGVTVFDDEEMVSIYAPYLNKQVNFNDINHIIREIKTRYKERGYLTTTVYFPKQDVKEGVVEIAVIEGKMGQLSIEGNRFFSTGLIKSYMRVPQGQILNMNELNKNLLRLNKNSDLQTKAVIAPGKEPQTTDIIIKTEDKFPWHVGVLSDNQGSRLLGKYRGGTYVRGTNVTGHNDNLFVNTMMNSRFLAKSVSYKTPLNTKGTQIGLNFSQFFMKLGQEFKQFDITGATTQGSVELSQELYLAENREVTALGGLKAKSIKKTVAGTKTNNDQLRIPYFGINWTEKDAHGSTEFSPRVEFGTSGFLGASSRNHPSASRASTGGFYVKYAQDLTRTQKMPWETFLKMNLQFQTVSHALTSSEQMQIGGESSVRGYPEGDYLADVGENASIEWNFPMYLIPKDWTLPKDKTPLRNLIVPYVFMDQGAGRLKKVLPGEKKSKSLFSLGGGVRMHLYKTVFVNMDLAAPLGDDASSGNGPSTFHFSLQSEI